MKGMAFLDVTSGLLGGILTILAPLMSYGQHKMKHEMKRKTISLGSQ
jgi:hypothetical protein